MSYTKIPFLCHSFPQRWLATCVLLLGLAATAPAREPGQVAGGGPPEDRAAIETVLRHYLRVTDEQDKSSIAKAFHPSAHLMSVSGSGELRAMSQEDWWARTSRVGKGAREAHIRGIDVVGAAAIARIDIVTGSSSSTDYFTLLKLGDGWRIVNKVVSTVIR